MARPGGGVGALRIMSGSAIAKVRKRAAKPMKSLTRVTMSSEPFRLAMRAPPLPCLNPGRSALTVGNRTATLSTDKRNDSHCAPS